MPSGLTITSTDFTSFVTNTVIDPSEVNNNFSTYRGHLLPVDPSTSAAADASYDLGSTDYRFRQGHFSGTVSSSEFSGPINLGITTVSAAYSASITGGTIFCSNASTAAYTITLPTPVGNTGKTLTIKKTDDNFIPINLTSTSGTIDSTTTSSVNTIDESVIVISDGTNWARVRRDIPSYTKSFTPTGSWSANVTYSGNYRRDGGWIDIEYYLSLSGAATSASLQVDMVSGLTINAANVEATNQRKEWGKSTIYSPSSYWGPVRGVDATTLDLLVDNGAAITLQITGTVPFTWGSTDSINAVVRVPVLGWNS